MSDPTVQWAALIIFGLAICHTFMAGKILQMSHKFKHDTMSYRLMHILGEVECVFGIWALILVFIMAGLHGKADVFNYLQNTVDYAEPLLVFVIMTMAATLPVIYFAKPFYLCNCSHDSHAQTDGFLFLSNGYRPTAWFFYYRTGCNDGNGSDT